MQTHKAIWRILPSLPIQRGRSWARWPNPGLSNQNNPWPIPLRWLDWEGRLAPSCWSWLIIGRLMLNWPETWDVYQNRSQYWNTNCTSRRLEVFNFRRLLASTSLFMCDYSRSFWGGSHDCLWRDWNPLPHLIKTRGNFLIVHSMLSRL